MCSRCYHSVSYTHLDVYKRQLVDRAPLTEKQQNVYESIMQYQRVNGYAPTIREDVYKRQAPKDVLQKDVESIVEKLRGIGAIEE